MRIYLSDEKSDGDHVSKEFVIADSCGEWRLRTLIHNKELGLCIMLPAHRAPSAFFSFWRCDGSEADFAYMLLFPHHKIGSITLSRMSNADLAKIAEALLGVVYTATAHGASDLQRWISVASFCRFYVVRELAVRHRVP
jgi:hypothetical protein